MSELNTEMETSNDVKDMSPSGNPDGNVAPDNFKLSRKNFLLNYKLHCALRSVVIHPFEPETFACTDFLKWVAKAKEFFIKKTWKSNRSIMASACVMTFATYAEADNAICDLRIAFGEGVVVRHTKNNLVCPDFEVEHIVEQNSRDSLSTRVLVLEGLPNSTTQEQLSEFFPEARTVLLVSHDPQQASGLALVEYATAEKARQVLEDHHFSENDRSYIVVDGWQVFMSKYKNRLNQAERAMRKHPLSDRRLSCEKKELDDEERMSKCRNLKQMTEIRDACLDDLSQTPNQRILAYVNLTEEMTLLAACLNWDAGRREREHLPLPEPNEMKTWKQLYKEDQNHGGDAYVKPVVSNGESSVPSLLDMNPFEVVGMKRSQKPPKDYVPSKKLMESKMKQEPTCSSQDALSGCMQNIKSLTSNLTSQVRTMEDLLQQQQQQTPHQNQQQGSGDTQPTTLRLTAEGTLLQTNIPSLTQF